MSQILGPTSPLRVLMALESSGTYVPDPEAIHRVARSYERLLALMKDGQTNIYGLHTHYGHNVTTSVDISHWQTHQKALLKYLEVGVGPYLPDSVVRRALHLQGYKTALGFSGIHPDTWQDLRALADAPSLPKVPSLGSLGASGDLIPMAHAVAPLFRDHDPRGPRDVIGLVNTNAMMASLGVELCAKAWKAYWTAHGLWLLATRALGVTVQDLCQHLKTRSTGRPYQSFWIKTVESMDDSLPKQKGTGLSLQDPPLQERYSIRCAPQILLDMGENLQFATSKIIEEALGVADNPVVTDEGVCHGGLFYALGIATGADLINDALARLAELIDRQILLLVTPELSHGLPMNLQISMSNDRGDHLKGLHQLASSLLQKVRSLAMPSRMLSFSCESHNQDLVPAGMTSLLQVDQVAETLEEMLRVGSFVCDRAYRLREGMALPPCLHLSQWHAYQTEESWERLQFLFFKNIPQM